MALVQDPPPQSYWPVADYLCSRVDVDVLLFREL